MTRVSMALFRSGVRCTAVAVASAMLLATVSSALAAQQPRNRSRVTVQLLADTASIVSGRSFHLAIAFEIEPDWHIYWSNPGDSGLATEVAIQAPPGFKIGPIQFPGPERFELPGDIVNYGYGGRVLLFALVTPPKVLDEGSVATFHVDASWLVCRESCFPGSGSARLDLRIVDDNEEDDEPWSAGSRILDSAAGSALGKHFARLPQPFDVLEGAALSWVGTSASPILVITVQNAAKIDFFPHFDDGMKFVGRTIDSVGPAETLRVRIAYARTTKPGLEDRPARPAAGGVLMVHRGTKTTFYELWSQYPQPTSDASRIAKDR